METISVALQPEYSAWIEWGGLARAGERLRPLLPAGGCVCAVSTANVRALWGDTLEAGLRAAGMAPTWLLMPDGEPHKRLDELEALAEGMLRAGAGRDASVLALGGGMAGDVAALLASLYMRGVALVQIPTTLVAMIDSALGGKTAVNLASGKNLLGTFHHPRGILVDPQVLTTLPAREFRSGLAEAVKYGIIRDRDLFDWIAAHAGALARLDAAALEHVVAAGLRHKAAVVAADEREGGLRQILNFGHTLGHALESATRYQTFLHGEAVAWGMIAAGRLAVRLGRMPAAEAERAEAVVRRLCAPLPALTTPAADILRHAARDKKVRAGVLHFVLPTRIGAVEIVKNVPETEIIAVWNQLLKEQMP